jgi:hypothetical protein
MTAAPHAPNAVTVLLALLAGAAWLFVGIMELAQLAKAARGSTTEEKVDPI